jgi:hypothetical protein
MKNIRKETAMWVQLGSFFSIWLLLVFLFDVHMNIGLEALKRFPEAVVVYSAAHLYFTTRAWRWKAFRGWLVPFPDLEGTWAGTIQSTWRDASKKSAPPPIPVLLVIRQTFSSISCVMYSNESTSSGCAAQMTGEASSEQPRLSFIYSNQPRPTVRDRSEIHDGAAILRVAMRPKRILEGKYWTDRKTTGEIHVLFKSRRLAGHFSM